MKQATKLDGQCDAAISCVVILFVLVLLLTYRDLTLKSLSGHNKVQFEERACRRNAFPYSISEVLSLAPLSRLA
jgi:hypothetical protein